MLPQIQGPGKVYLPKISRENAYLDWRIITDGVPLSIKSDVDTLDNILATAWKTSIAYFEAEWQKL